MYNILIADDEKDELDVIFYLIHKYHFSLNVFHASNGKDAFHILQNEAIDILLTDIQMPFMDGLELATQAKLLYPSIEILFFSGHDDFEYAKQALSLKAVNYIIKPINPEEFQKSMQETLMSVSRKKNQYDEYAKSSFWDSPSPLSYDHSDDTSSCLEDSSLLSEIEKAIQLKNPSLLQEKVTQLLSKYESNSVVSHIYIRYVSTTLLQYLLKELPSSDDYSFLQASEIIYCANNFTQVKEYIQKYLDRVLIHMKKESDAANYPIYIIEQYIHENYMHDLSLNQLADMVYLNPKYLSDIFSQAKGISLNKYIRNIRLEKATALLLTSNMKISDISNSIGYPNVSYFCKLFQNKYNQSPEKFRQNRGK